MSIRKKLIGFWRNRSLAREQVEQELRDLPESLKYLEASPSVRWRMDRSRGKEWKKYVFAWTSRLRYLSGVASFRSL